MALSDVQTEALKGLDGMAEIVRAEMVAHVGYISPTVCDPSRVGAICRGHEVCAYGAYLLGCEVEIDYSGVWPELPATDENDRPDFMAAHPAIKLGYDALHEAGREYAIRHADVLGAEAADDGSPLDGVEDFKWLPERLFETYRIPPRELLPIIARAKAIIAGED